MAKHHLSIRATLLIIIALLNFLIAVPVGYLAIKSFVNYQRAEQVAETTLDVEKFYRAQKNLSLERGASVSIFYVNDNTFNVLFEDLINSRQRVDELLNDGFSAVADDGRAFDKQLNDIKRAKAGLDILRKKISEEIRKPVEQRDPEVPAQVFEVTTDLIDKISQFITPYQKETLLYNPLITRQLRLTNIVWEISEYAGQEYALMGQTIAKNEFPDDEKRQSLMKMRDRIDYGIEIVEGAIKNSQWPHLLPILDEARTQYFITFESTKSLFNYGAQNPNKNPSAAEGEQAAPIYPVNVTLWHEMALQAVKSFHHLADRVLEMNNEYTLTLKQQAWRSILLSVLLLLFATGISFYSWYVISRRVIRPVNEMIDELYIETHRTQAEDEKYTSDEITKLMEVLEVFRLNSKQLEIERDRAATANTAKTEFLANMSHEIRTPMNVILGVGNILSDTKPLTDKQQEYINVLRISAESLLDLINDLLDFSKLDTENLALEEIPFSLQNLVEDIELLMKVKAQEKGIDFRLNLHGIKNKSYLGDPTRIRQILINLCGNAIKFTEMGYVALDVKWRPSISSKQGELTFVVEDTGIGIPEDKQEHIFEKFTQADTTVTRKYGGTGLGLAITKKIIDIMHGVISLKSKEGMGSTFTVTMPLEQTNKKPQALSKIDIGNSGPTAHKRNGRILIVEDHMPNRLVATTYLDQLGAEYDIAENGEEAFAKACDNEYSAILMDVQMPGMDGYQTTRAIREFEKQHGRSHSYIIGLTAFASFRDRENCLKAGMDDYIAKPFNPDKIKKLI